MANNQKILLISETYVKNNSAVMQNVEDKFILSHILESQDVHIQNILGSPLYSDIIKQFEAYNAAYSTGYTGNINTIVSPEYLSLVDDYVQPTLLYYTLYESMIDFATKITNKGLVQQNSPENSQVADIAYFNIMRKGFKDKAEWYAQRLMTYLITYQDTFPKYRDWTANLTEETIAPTRSNYHSGMYLGGCSRYYNVNTPDGPRCV